MLFYRRFFQSLKGNIMSPKSLLDMAGMLASSVSNAMVTPKHRELFTIALSLTGFVVVWLGVS